MDSGQSLIACLNLRELLQHASLLKRFVGDIVWKYRLNSCSKEVIILNTFSRLGKPI